MHSEYDLNRDKTLTPFHSFLYYLFLDNLLYVNWFSTVELLFEDHSNNLRSEEK